MKTLEEKQVASKWFANSANWFVLFVKAYEERRVTERLQLKLDPEIYTVFVPTKDYTFRKNGLTTVRRIPWIGGYVFIATMRFLYEGGVVTLELDETGSETAYNVYGADSVISRETADGMTYYLYNGRGDVVQLTNSAAIVTVEYDYDAFGQLHEAYYDDTNPFRYCGEYWDYETKNYYLRARYYSPGTGRFTSRDTYTGRYADPLSLNRYTYGHNNPVKYHDPTGHAVTDWDRSNLSASELAQLQSYTDQWWAATNNKDHKAAAAIAAQAEAVRNSHFNNGQKQDTWGYVYNSNGSVASGGNTVIYNGGGTTNSG